MGRSWGLPYQCSGWAGLGASYPISDDAVDGFWPEFGNGTVPNNVIIDSEGIVRYRGIGFSETEIENILESLLSPTNTVAPSIPERFTLKAFPNPFNPSLTIEFMAPGAAQVQVRIYNQRGQLVATPFSGQPAAGLKQVQWNATENPGSGLSSGIYLVQVQVGSQSQSRKIVYLR